MKRKSKSQTKPADSQAAAAADATDAARTLEDRETAPDQEAEPRPPTPEEQIRELELRLAASEDRGLRAKAELDNARKRAGREILGAQDYAKANTIQEFLPVLDHFQMAMDHISDSANVKTLQQGMDMIFAEFRRTFENLGIKPVEAEGKPFDPGLHEAVAEEPSPTIPAGHVIRQWKSGFQLGERLLRPATVVVSSGPPETPAEDQEKD